jgi:hypothetical protein
MEYKSEHISFQFVAFLPKMTLSDDTCTADVSKSVEPAVGLHIKSDGGKEILIIIKCC